MMSTEGLDGTPNGVLIDFDHAAIMEPGSQTPPTPEFERSCTLPFISMDYGYKIHEPFSRFLHHDLESLMWTMVWYCQKQPAWLRGAYGEVCGLKLGWCDSRYKRQTPPDDIREGAEELWKPILDIMGDWIYAHTTFHLIPRTDKDWVDILDRHLKCPPEMGEAWMTFAVHRNKIRRVDRDS
jgi:Fungal protein kinase